MEIKVPVFKTLHSFFGAIRCGPQGISLAVRWFRLCTSTAGVAGLFHGRGTKIPHDVRCGQKIKDVDQVTKHEPQGEVCIRESGDPPQLWREIRAQENFEQEELGLGLEGWKGFGEPKERVSEWRSSVSTGIEVGGKKASLWCSDEWEIAWKLRSCGFGS